MLTIPDFLLETNELVFKTIGLELKSICIEKESAAYTACEIVLHDKKILFRTAKTTPTKTGQFVTLWKRIEKGPIAPFSITDQIDFVIINTTTATHFGQFVFPIEVLINQGIISTETKEGKRALRVYPPWDITTSKQAQKTQEWQLDYFLKIPIDGLIAKNLYALDI